MTDSKADVEQGDGIEAKKDGGWFAEHQVWLVIFAITGSILLGSAWLVFPYSFGSGLIFEVGTDVREGRRDQAISIGQFMTSFSEAGNGEAEVEALYASTKYFELTDKGGVVAKYRPDIYIVFLVTESTHTVDLPVGPPRAVLVVDGVEYPSADVEGPLDPGHHRTSTVRFSKVDAAGQPIIVEGTTELELRVASTWDENAPGEFETRSMSWSLPIVYPEYLIDPGIWNPVMVMALSAGLLSAVLTPCLLQLVIIYLATITGMSVTELGRPGAVPAVAARRMFIVALAFVTGFTILFTGIGALIGWTGKEAQLIFAAWSRPVSIGAGILVVVLGLWVGYKSQAPLVCKIPVPSAIKKFDEAGIVSSALMAAGFSLGCITCFGGAIIATLLIYVGALGSATIGALVLFMFSMGVAIPFMAAAVFLSKVMPAMSRLATYAPYIGFFSMTVMVAFGIVLIFDYYHAVSDFIYPFLGLA